MNNLPSDILLELMIHLPLSDLIVFCSLNHYFYTFSCRDFLWQRRIKIESKVMENTLPNSSLKATYIDLIINTHPVSLYLNNKYHRTLNINQDDPLNTIKLRINTLFNYNEYLFIYLDRYSSIIGFSTNVDTFFNQDVTQIKSIYIFTDKLLINQVNERFNFLHSQSLSSSLFDSLPLSMFYSLKGILKPYIKQLAC